MKTTNTIKGVIFLLAFLTVLSTSYNLAHGRVLGIDAENDPKEQTPQYVPGEVLVKFKEGVNPEEVLQSINLESRDISRVHSIKPAVNKFKKDLKLEKDSDGWYWFRGKSYKEVGDISDEEVFQEAYRQMINIEKSLYRSYKVNLPEGTGVEEAVAKLENNPKIEYAQPNYIMKLHMVPNDPYYHTSGTWEQNYDDLWGIKKIECEKAWDISEGEEVVVAVIDGGVDYNHPDLTDNIYRDAAGNVIGYDFSQNDDDPMDVNGHGTHVAGIIAAAGNNNIGVIGVAPKVKIMPVKIFPRSTSEICAQGIKFAADNGAQVLNNSWGMYDNDAYPRFSDPIVEGAIDYAHGPEFGCVIVCSAGNEGRNVAKASPASYDKTIAVAATTQNDKKSLWVQRVTILSASNFGELIDVAAPGGGVENPDEQSWYGVYDVLSTVGSDASVARDSPPLVVSDGYVRLGGTSMAAPHVSGIAALILSQNPNINNEDMRAILQASSEDLGDPGRDHSFGYGRVNAYRAVTMGCVRASIDLPHHNSFVRGYLDITGSAFRENDFERYEVLYAPKDSPENVTLINSSTTPVEKSGVLGSLDTTKLIEQDYIVTLNVYGYNGNTIERSIEITVDNINQPPVWDLSDNGRGIRIGGLLEFKAEAHDVDDPARLQVGLTYSASNLPPGATFHPGTKVFSWQPGESDKGNYEVTFTVTDGENVERRTIPISTVYVEERCVTGGSGWFMEYPKIYQNKVVWQQKTPEQYNPQIYMYDVDVLLGDVTQLSASEEIHRNPSIYEDKVVWNTSNSFSDSNIYLYDLSNSVLTQIADSPRYQADAFIYKDKILYTEILDSSNYDIYMYDLSRGVTQQITTDPNGQSKAVMDGNIIVYGDNRNHHRDIYMYDLSQGTEQPVVMAPHAQSDKDIFGNRIVWEDNRNRGPIQVGPVYNYDVYMLDLSTGDETQITTSLSNQCDPKIFDDKIVYSERYDLFDEGNICLYDLSTNIEFQLTVTTDEDRCPDVYEDTVVWIRTIPNMEHNSHLFIAKLYYVPQITSVSPGSAASGALFTITGKNFGYNQRDSQVLFSNGASAPIESWSNTEIVCRMPEDAESGEVRVVTKGGESNGVEVVILPKPKITYISPEKSKAGSYIYIRGENFGSKTASSRVEFADFAGGEGAYIYCWYDTYIRCKVPELEKGEYTVTVINEAGRSNSITFEVVEPPTVHIFSIYPNPAYVGEYVRFYGYVTTPDPDVTITNYYWYSSINGYLGSSYYFYRNDLSAGEHTIWFYAKDSNGIWSTPVTTTLTIKEMVPQPEYKRGDLDKSGVVDMADMYTLYQAINGEAKPPIFDCDKDGDVDYDDSYEVYRRYSRGETNRNYDVNWDGKIDYYDYRDHYYYVYYNQLPLRLDFNGDGVVDMNDMDALFEFLYK